MSSTDEALPFGCGRRQHRALVPSQGDAAVHEPGADLTNPQGAPEQRNAFIVALSPTAGREASHLALGGLGGR